MYACLYRPPAPDANVANALVALAADFSPRYERHRDDLVSIDVSGLGRLFGPARAIGEELRREAAARGVRVHVALAGTRIAALVLVHARPGLTLVEPGEEAAALAPLPIGVLEKVHDSASSAISAFKRWGLRTLGELAALPPADLAARLGPQGLVWQAIARGEEVGPLVPDVPEERFESSIELEWPIDGLEPLSFVLTRLLEPLSTRLERRDRGAAVLHVMLGLVTRDTCTRSLQLPSPIRDVRTLRTLALLDLESHPPTAAIDRVTLVIDPTPGRVLQHTLFTRAHPTPEQLSTLLARLGALMGQDRIGAPALVDSHRPGAFAMTPFAVDHDQRREHSLRRAGSHPRALKTSASSVDSRPRQRAEADPEPPAASHQPPLVSALRRCRHPVPARVAVADGRPVRVTTDRRGFVGGQVRACAGPWRTSGEWWSACGHAEAAALERCGEASASVRGGGGAPPPVKKSSACGPREAGGAGAWNRDEWDVALGDGAVYRIFCDRETGGWWIDAIVD